MSTALADYRGPTAAHFQPPEPQSLEAIYLEYARSRVLADIDSFCDQLDTFGKGHVESDYVLRVPARLQQADDAVVLHALLTATEPADVVACRNLLVQRYLDREDAQVLRLAGQFAEECVSTGINTVSVADRFHGGAGRLSAELSVFDAQRNADDDGQRRVCLSVDTGCSIAHVRMTQAECERLIAALQRGVKSFPAESL